MNGRYVTTGLTNPTRPDEGQSEDSKKAQAFMVKWVVLMQEMGADIRTRYTKVWGGLEMHDERD